MHGMRIELRGIGLQPKRVLGLLVLKNAVEGLYFIITVYEYHAQALYIKEALGNEMAQSC